MELKTVSLHKDPFMDLELGEPALLHIYAHLTGLSHCQHPGNGLGSREVRERNIISSSLGVNLRKGNFWICWC